MEVFLQACISGLAQGCVYALVALGFVLIYKATEVANFAQGELMMVGAYIHFSLVVFGGLDPLLAFPVTLVLAGLMGATVERVLIHPLADELPFVLLTVTIGLLDIQLPKLSGYDVAERLRSDERTKGVPIIAVTSYALSGDEPRAFDVGCDDYVSKPYRPKILLEHLRKYLTTEGNHG